MPVSSLKHPARAGSPAQGSFFLPPCDKRLYSCPTSLAASLPLTLHPTTLPSAFPPAFQLEKEDFCLRDNPPFICEDKNMKRGFSAMCLFRPLFFFCLLSLHIPAASIVASPHPARASAPSDCPQGERAAKAWLAKCTWGVGGWGGEWGCEWDSGVEDEFSRLSSKKPCDL